MPEELSLPGIDPAPEAPAAPQPPAEDTSTQSASVDSANTAPIEPQPDSQEIVQKRESRGVQKRIDELVARERAADARTEQTQDLLRQVIQGVLTPAQARAGAPGQAEAAPKQDDFGTWQEFNAATTRWEARQAVRAEFEQQTRAYQEHNQRQQYAHHTQQVEEAKYQLHGIVGNQMRETAAQIPEFAAEIAEADFEVPLNVEAAMAVSGAAGHVALYFARNPQVMAQLSRLPDLALSAQVSRIANAMRSGAYSVSNAPPPGRPGGTRGTGPSDYPTNATPEQHLAWEKRNRGASARK